MHEQSAQPAPSLDELIGMAFSALNHPDSLQVAAEAFSTVLTGGAAQSQVLSLRKDGTAFHVDAHDTIYSYRGVPHILGIARDITERVQTEAQLREMEGQYRNVFEATGDGLAITDMNGVLVEVNPVLCAMHGYSHDELIGLHVTSVIHPAYHPVLAEFLATIKGGGACQTQALELRKDGTPFPVEVHGTAFTYMGAPHALFVIRDVSERVRAEEQLREKEAQYRSIFEVTTDGLIINDLDMDAIVEVNPAFCAMHGYTRDEMIGLPPTTFIHPDSQYLYPQYLQTVKAGADFHTKALHVRKDGTPFPIEVHGTTFMYQGKLRGLALVRDITEQVQAFQLLERRVAERTQELSTLLAVSHNVASTLELQPLLGLILAQLKTVVDYTAASIFIVEGEHVRVLDYCGPLPREQVLDLRVPLAHAVGYQAVLHHDGPVILDDLWDRSPLALAFQGLPAPRRSPPRRSATVWRASCTTRSPRLSTA